MVIDGSLTSYTNYKKIKREDAKAQIKTQLLNSVNFCAFAPLRLMC